MSRSPYDEGRHYANTHDFMPCLCGVMREFGYSTLAEAKSFARGYFKSMRALGKEPETRCDCRLSSPFCS